MADFMVPRIGPIEPLLLLVDHFGLFRDTIKSTIAAIKIEIKPYSWNRRTLPLSEVFDVESITFLFNMK